MSLPRTSSPFQFRIENIQPVLPLGNMKASLAFYEMPGFEKTGWSTDEFAGLTRDGCGIYLSAGGQEQPGISIWIWFDGDIHALHAALLDKNVSIKQPPVQLPWALEMHVEDPDGHILRWGTDPGE